MLTDKTLAEIDQLFDDAEHYFSQKQELLLKQKKDVISKKNHYHAVSSKINTNLSVNSNEQHPNTYR